RQDVEAQDGDGEDQRIRDFQGLETAGGERDRQGDCDEDDQRHVGQHASSQACASTRASLRTSWAFTDASWSSRSRPPTDARGAPKRALGATLSSPLQADKYPEDGVRAIIAPAMASLSVGDTAPDFDLPLPGTETLGLSNALASGPVVLLTYIFDFSPG